MTTYPSSNIYRQTVALLTLVFTAFLSASGKADLKMPDEIVLGAIYNVFHEEYSDEAFRERIDRDFANIRDANLNTIMIFPVSQWDKNTHELAWDRTDYMIRRIESLQLEFVPLMYKEEQGRHFLPIWKFQEIEGLWDTHATGALNSRENADPQNPAARELIDDYFEAVVERYGKSPSLLMYNLWNEPHYVSESDLAIAQFRDWLRAKYGDLDTLGRIYGEDYTDWSQVTPKLNDNWDSSMPQIDWSLFTYDLNSKILRSFMDTIRKLDDHTPVNANPVGTVWTNYDIGSRYTVDNWPMARESDIHGISHYIDIWERAQGKTAPHYKHCWIFNQARSAAGDKPWMLTELQTNGQNGLALNGFFGYDDLHLISYAALANDCKGILYWKWSPFMRGRQSLGRGLTQTNGDLAPRGEAVKNLGAMLKTYGKLLKEAEVVPARTGILLDMVGLHKSLEPGDGKAPMNFIREAYEGTYKALWEKNIAVDAVRMDQPLTLDQLRQYRVLYLPFQIVMRREVAELLSQWVAEGGWLVADARSAVIDEQDFAYATNPGAGLHELFGVTRLDFYGVKSAHQVVTADPSFWGKLNHLTFEGLYYREKWQLASDTQTIARFPDTGEPAMTVREHGKGKAILCAVPMGASYLHDDSDPVNRLIADLAIQAGAKPDATWKTNEGSSQAVYASVHRTKDGKTVIYLINYHEELVSGTLSMEINNVSHITSLQDNTALGFQQKVETLTVEVTLPARRARVLLVE